MNRWAPRATVATVVERDGLYLLVEERDKATGRRVFNQPAGHLERGETLGAAALREVREETGWEVELTGVIGLSLWTAPADGPSFLRTTFVARPLRAVANAVIDRDILAVHWLDYEAMQGLSARMRSPLVLAAVHRHRAGDLHPLDVLFDG